MRLYECEKGKSYVVQELMLDEKITRRLEALGINEHTTIHILNKKGSGTMIIKVRGTRLALGRKITEGILIQEGLRDE